MLPRISRSLLFINGLLWWFVIIVRVTVCRRRTVTRGSIVGPNLTKAIKAIKLAAIPAARLIASMAPTEKASNKFPYGLLVSKFAMS